MDYKPGLLAASIFSQKKMSSDAVLQDLFSKQVKAKKSEKTVKRSQKEEAVNGAIGDTLKEIANTTGKFVGKHNQKIGSKRKHEDTTTTPTKSKKVKKESAAAVQKSGDKRKVEDTTVTPKKSKKAKADSTQNPDIFPFVHESLFKKSQQQNAKKVKKVLSDDHDDEPQAWPPQRKKRDKTADKRTIFIGNCPLSADKKVITCIFKEYGPIESIRFRCGPTARLELPKKAVVIKKEFHEKAKSYVSFVVFQDEKSANKALEKNGHVVDGHHLRVDLASNQNQHDKKHSIFVGNLPFTVTEDDLRSHFEDCGDILNVRVVRDRQTSIGKGIAFIQFDSKDGVILAQKLNEKEFQERSLRVMRCSSKMKPKTEDKSSTTKNNPRKTNSKAKSKPVTFKGKAKDYYSRSEPRSAKPRPSFAPTNKTKSKKSFRDIFEAKIERRVNKRKQKKRPGSNKADALSAIFGDIPADMKKLKMENPKFKSKKPKDKKKEKMKAKKKLKKAE